MDTPLGAIGIAGAACVVAAGVVAAGVVAAGSVGVAAKLKAAADSGVPAARS